MRSVSLPLMVLLSCFGCSASSGCGDTPSSGDSRNDAAASMEDDELPSQEQDASTLTHDAAVALPDATSSSSSRDPGQPAAMYGPKGDANLLVDGQKVAYLFYSALTPSEPDRAHLFLRPAPAGNEGIRSYYVSLVFARSGWAQGEYAAAQAGRVRFELMDGRVYEADAASLQIKLRVDTLTLLENAFFVRGSAEMTVPSATPGRSALNVEMRINSPAM